MWLFNNNSLKCTCEYRVDSSICHFKFSKVVLAHIMGEVGMSYKVLPSVYSRTLRKRWENYVALPFAKLFTAVCQICRSIAAKKLANADILLFRLNIVFPDRNIVNIHLAKWINFTWNNFINVHVRARSLSVTIVDFNVCVRQAQFTGLCPERVNTFDFKRNRTICSTVSRVSCGWDEEGGRVTIETSLMWQRILYTGAHAHTTGAFLQAIFNSWRLKSRCQPLFYTTECNSSLRSGTTNSEVSGVIAKSSAWRHC